MNNIIRRAFSDNGLPVLPDNPTLQEVSQWLRDLGVRASIDKDEPLDDERWVMFSVSKAFSYAAQMLEQKINETP